MVTPWLLTLLMQIGSGLDPDDAEKVTLKYVLVALTIGAFGVIRVVVGKREKERDATITRLSSDLADRDATITTLRAAVDALKESSLAAERRRAEAAESRATAEMRIAERLGAISETLSQQDKRLRGHHASDPD